MFDQPFDLIGFFQIAAIAKLFLLVLGAFYFIFTVVVHRQITLMIQVLDSKISPLVKAIAFIQIIAAAILFILIAVLA